MTKAGRRIDTAPEALYPDRGCASWPSCFTCPFQDCIDTSDKVPTGVEQQRAQVRRQVVRLYHQDLPVRGIAATLGIDRGLVDRGLAKYRSDIQKARRSVYGDQTTI